MADKEKKNEAENTKAEKAESGAKIDLVTWIIVGAVVAILSGSGFFLGQLMAGPGQKQEAATVEKDVQPKKDVANSNSDESWYYNDLEAIVVNPDEPGATRFVRVGIILEMDSAITENEAIILIERQKPPLMNWLNLYFKSLTLDEMKNDRDMRRILAHIADSFNEMLFKNAKPQIKKVLIKEFNIQ
ncbi:MAG: flagellar basal body-associated FliL family protein [Anaerohalosphaeraceae bacterium]|nr:flagellar basal body-associated FliL family protein [Anaerohalosphaeraceae bacterium]